MSDFSRLKVMAAAIFIFVFTVPFLFVTPKEAMYVHGICSIIYIPIIVVWIRVLGSLRHLTSKHMNNIGIITTT